MGNARHVDESGEAARKTRLLMRVLVSFLVMCVATMTLALTDSANALAPTLGFYAVALSFTVGLMVALRLGHTTFTAWAVSLGFWALIASVLPFFGGMKGNNGAVFAVSIVLFGSVVGSRPAVVLAILSCAWAGLVAWAELTGHLPPQLGPYTTMNSWNALAVTLLLTAVLVQSSLESLRSSHARAEANARQRDEALRHSIDAQKMELVGSLTSGIAHDFNNLLTVMVSTADYLRERVGADADSLGALDDLDGATMRAQLMTQQLLSFGRAESVVEPIDIAFVVRSLEPLLPRLLGPTIAIVAHAPAPVPVSASRAGLEQILLNLAVNGRDAMPKGGTLTLSATCEGAEGVLRVIDTGIGMDEATRARAFEAFFTTKSRGTGLGLATVRAIAERHGGRVRVESSPGQGTTFDIRFELREPSSDGTPEGTPRLPEVKNLVRVLLVEDDLLVRRSTTRVLERAGFDLVAVSNGREALALLEHTRDFAVVVSDIVMPELDGEALARQVASLYPELPIVLCSGNRQPAADVMSAPRRLFVAKPASSEALVAAIEQLRRR